MQHEKTRYLRLGMLQYGPDLLPSFLHRTERTKFANWKNGYDLETMKPQFFLPSFGPNVTVWVRHPAQEHVTSVEDLSNA